MLAVCLILSGTYYAKNIQPGLIGSSKSNGHLAKRIHVC